ncbi:uncharacterized protein LOC143788430 [Ranitomeya variabilis]|uniref:uncharacterized protein LOC143788430 n=1 Tax=Ranitomeya variabilis TaxID=490064 RepID=UPI004056DA3F
MRNIPFFIRNMSFHQVHGEEELGINVTESNSSATRSNTRIWMICFILISAFTTAIFSFCFFNHLLVEDLCYANATLGTNRTEWIWDLSSCKAKQIKSNGTLVEISSSGLYTIEIQAFASRAFADIVLQIIPSKRTFVGGSFNGSGGNSYYAIMSQTFKLNKGDGLKLTLNGNKQYFSTEEKTTFWRIFKNRNI